MNKIGKIDLTHAHDDKSDSYYTAFDSYLISLDDDVLLESLLRLIKNKQPIKNTKLLLEKCHKFLNVFLCCDYLHSQKIIDDELFLLLKLIKMIVFYNEEFTRSLERRSYNTNTVHLTIK